jgi:predicted RNase H-like nuclease
MAAVGQHEHMTAASLTPTSTTASSSARVLGVDSAGPLGWVGVVIDDDGFVEASCGALAELVEWAEPVGVIGVDIPIGLVPGGGRLADREARFFLKGNASSVFAAPPLEVVDMDDYAEANELLVGMGVSKMSRQAWALLPKIRETALVAEADERVYEVHPETSFRAMAGDALRWRKKSWNGLHERRRLLTAEGIVVPESLDTVGAVPADDLLDAAAAAWSARRILRGQGDSLPSPPEECGGRKIAIWY